MCAQKDVLKKIRKAGKVNGYSIDLAEAQAKDFIMLQKRVDAIETKLDDVQKVQVEHGTKLDMILQRLNSPVEDERKAGILWYEFRSLIKSWKGWVFIIFFLLCVALAGDRVLQILHWIPTGL